MINKAISELTKAESIMSNWKWLPGSQIKIIISHLIRSLDAIASYALNKETILERSYLVLSSVRLFNNQQTEQEFYNTYFHLRNLLRKNIERINEESFKVSNYKQELLVSKEYFNNIISSVNKIIKEVTGA